MNLQRPLVVNTELVRPLPKEEFKSFCSHCDKPQANWMVIDPNHVGADGKPEPLAYPICSLCYLYHSDWADSHTEEIKALIQDTEAEKKKETPAFAFDRDLVGNLVNSKDTDRILAAIAMMSRLMLLQNPAHSK